MSSARRGAPSSAGRLFALRLLLVAAGLGVAGLALEVGLRVMAARPIALGAVDPHRRPHHLYTQTGLGKCYPSDPRGYFPYDLRTDDGREGFGALIADVAHVPEGWPIARKVEHLVRHAPFCTNIELVPLNSGPDRDRPRHVLLIGDSFAFGEGLRVEDTIGFRLGEHLPGVNFPNMAWPGAGVDTLFDVADTPPEIDRVLYFYNLNDVLRTEALANRRVRQHEDNRARDLTRHTRGTSTAGAICRASSLCRWLRQRRVDLERSQEAADYYHELYFGADNAAPRQETFERIAAMHATLAARDARLVVVLFPLFYKEPLSDYPLRHIHARVADELRQREVEIVDLLPAYERYVSWDRFLAHPLDRHPSAEAIAVAAAYLKDHLDLEEGTEEGT